MTEQVLRQKQDKTSENNPVDSSLPWKEFRAVTVKMIKETGRHKEGEKLNVFNKEKRYRITKQMKEQNS